jgi:signal-transduction protein with cAMP-binding, CBS, and nucleotidyltransferase domain
MQEIARFLAANPPFDGLPPEVLEQTAATVEVARYPRGTSILQQGGEPSRHLHVIVDGVVELRQADANGASELVETLASGETFGQLSLLSRAPHLWDVLAREDVLAYLIPAEHVERLRHHPGFEALLARRAGDRLRRAVAAHREPALLDLLSVRAGDLATRPLVTCDPGETVAEAARRMRAERISSLVVIGRSPGLVTASDLRDRVLAAGLSGTTPVEAVMSVPLHTMPAGEWFAALAEHLAATLEHCGLPRCPGGTMATNPARRVRQRAWQDLFGIWIEEPEETALLDAAVCFDFRQVHGDLDAEQALRPVIRRAAGNRRFLGRLARAALRRRPPLGFLRHLRGDHQGMIDLKAHGTAPIVDLARLLALYAGSGATGTAARLRVATERGTVGRTAADLAAAFEYLQEMRLRHQAGQIQAAAAPDDFVALAGLGALERRWLKDAFHLLHTCQESVRITFQTDLIA